MQNGSLNELLPWIGMIAFVLSWVFEFSKIKVNPWSWLLKQLAEALTKGVNERLDSISEVRTNQYNEMVSNLTETVEQLHNLNKRVDENEMQRIRWEILDFANSVKNGRKHSKDEYFHIMEMHEKYNRIIAYRGLQNGVVDIEYEIILDEYRHCRDNNDFL